MSDDIRLTARQIADDLNRRGGWKKPTKRTSQGYMGLCPNHADRNPSLSVRETESGRILLHCFAPTCTDDRSVYASVEDALGLEPGKLGGPGNGYEPAARAEPIKGARKEFEAIVPVPDDAPTFSLTSRRFKSKDFGQPVAAWVYRDADGRPMGYVARYEDRDEDGVLRDKMIWPWTFAIREGRRQWVVGAMPEPRVPYNLDRILGDPTAVIQWHEGEKAAEAGGRIFPAWIPTTTVGGGSAPHLTDFTPFAGRTVVICQDLDGPGSEYAMLVAQNLAEVGAAVRILRFPTSHVVRDGALVKETYRTESGDDMADHEDRGWNRDLVRQAIEATGTPLTWSIDDWKEDVSAS
jgi:hypothetical protein